MSNKAEVTIKNRQKKDKENLLEQLKRLPVVQVACLKTGISRATFYRFRSEDKEFAVAVEQALAEGVESMNDLSETRLIEMIQNRNFSAIQFWLRNNHRKYMAKLKIVARPVIEKLDPEREKIVKEAIRLVSLDDNNPVQKCNEKG